MNKDQKIQKIDNISETLNNMLKHCTLCPRNCGVDRYTKKGFCQADATVHIGSYNAHTGEEPPISGTHGSGTIFFSNCGMRCIFCQNWPISIKGNGKPATIQELADIMLSLQHRKCHNINLVTGTHYYPQIVDAYRIALENGLNIPLLTNCSGYESLEVIRLLEGIIDIYLADIKYTVEHPAREFSHAPDYASVNGPVLKEMYRQVGNIVIEDDLAKTGLWIRHMVVPGEVENSKRALEFIAELDANIFVSVMSQYFPAHKAVNHPQISRPVDIDEYYQVVDHGVDIGLQNMFIQELV